MFGYVSSGINTMAKEMNTFFSNELLKIDCKLNCRQLSTECMHFIWFQRCLCGTQEIWHLQHARYLALANASLHTQIHNSWNCNAMYATVNHMPNIHSRVLFKFFCLKLMFFFLLTTVYLDNRIHNKKEYDKMMKKKKQCE